jgi:multidrug resistance protein, MATE family
MRYTKQLRLWRHEVRPTLALALPIMSGMVGQMLMGLTDTIMVGRIGVVPLAAASFVNAVANLPLVFGIGLLSSIAVLTSQAYGARRPVDAAESWRHGLFLSILTGVGAMLAMFAVYPLRHRLGQPVEVAEASGTYLLLFGASLLPALIAQGCKQFSEALKHPWAATFVMLGGVGLNAFLNWLLIYGNWGFPAMGLAGAGWATLIARAIMMLVLLVYVLKAPALRAFQPARWFAPLDLNRFRQLIRIGFPVAGQHLFEVSAFASAAVMMGWISADAIAAHQIAINCAAFAFMFGLGLGAAACIRVGHAFGAGQFSRMRRVGFVAVALAALIMALFGVAFVLAGKPIASLFIGSATVIQLTTQLLIVAAVFQIADGVQVTTISALRGLSDVRTPAIIAIVAYWGLALPIGYWLAFRAQLGAVGMWIGLATGLAAAAIGLSWRYYKLTGKTFLRSEEFAVHRKTTPAPAH